MKSVLECDYKGLETTIFNAVRSGRSSDDRNSTALNVRISVQNKLSSFCRVLASKYHGRIKDMSTHTSYTLIQLMSQCLDMDKIIEKGTDDQNFNKHGKKTIREICEIAQYTSVEIDRVVVEYEKFKEIFRNLHTNENQYTKLFEFLLYKHHECKDQRCNDNCHLEDQLEIPKKPIPMKFLHLILREKELYQGIERFLHFFLRCSLKTHAEGVAESMGNVLDMHCQNAEE